MNPLDIIHKYYQPGSEIEQMLVAHSSAVARKALDCIDAGNLYVDKNFVYEAAMLHDIGIFKCHAPGIHCEGTLPYLCHGIEGRKILEAENLPRHALVCERHTGSGLSAEEISARNLPLPIRDMMPVCIEEKVICYADKFFSKSAGELEKEKSLSTVIKEMSRFGKASLTRFLQLHILFAR